MPCKYPINEVITIPLDDKKIVKFEVVSTVRRPPQNMDRFTPNPSCAILNYLFESFGAQATSSYLAKNIECQQCGQYVDLKVYGSKDK